MPCICNCCAMCSRCVMLQLKKQHGQKWMCTCSCSVSKFIPRYEPGEKIKFPIILVAFAFALHEMKSHHAHDSRGRLSSRWHEDGL